MKIAYLCTDPGVPVYGSKGASIHVRELTRALSELGHEVVVVCMRLGGDAPPGFDVPVLEFALDPRGAALDKLLRSDPEGGHAVARAVRAAVTAGWLPERAFSWLRGFEPDVLYERYALNGTAGLTLAEDLGVPHVLEVNAPLVDEALAHRGLAFAQTARALEAVIVQEADHVVAVSAELQRWLAGMGVADERITVVANGVDPDRFATRNGERGDVRRRLGLDGSPVVGFLGTLKPWHDVASLVRAAALLRRGGTPLHLLVVGDGPERERLEELAHHEGIADGASFVGAVPHAEVASYVGTFDVAVVPYGSTESSYFSPLKLFEYLAAGRPVVAADIGDIGHCIRPGETGLLYPPGDTEALSGAIAGLLGDTASASSLAAAGQEHVRAHHTWARNAGRVVEIAAELHRRKPAGARP